MFRVTKIVCFLVLKEGVNDIFSAEKGVKMVFKVGVNTLNNALKMIQKQRYAYL